MMSESQTEPSPQLVVGSFSNSRVFVSFPA